LSKEKRAYIKKFKEKLDRWSEKISDLAIDAGIENAEKQAEYQEHMERLHQKHKSLDDKVSGLKDADESAWERLKEEIESSWHDLKEKYEHVKSRLKKDIEKEKHK